MVSNFTLERRDFKKQFWKKETKFIIVKDGFKFPVKKSDLSKQLSQMKILQGYSTTLAPFIYITAIYGK